MKTFFQSLIIPLVAFCILADVYCWLQYDITVSNILYFDGETIVYVSFVCAFFLYVILGLEEFQRKVLRIMLSGWLPFCANAVYRQLSGQGLYKSTIDFYSLVISGVIVFAQIIWWRYKVKRSN